MLAIVLGLLPLAACQLLAGGPQTVDVNRTDIQTAAAFALGELNQLLGAQNTLVKVVSAQTQVVAGINYILSLQLQENGATKTCDVTVWSRPWLNINQLTKHMCFDNKRAVMPGGVTNTSIHRADVEAIANFALSEVNRLTGVKNTLEEVVSAKTQVVAGTNYFLTLRINDGSNSRTCDVTVWYQPWTDTKKLTKNTCAILLSKRGIPGGFSPIGVNDTEVQKVANFALSELNGLQGAQNTLDEVISAQVQVVSGLNYDLTIRLRNGGQTQICKVKVWIQSWLNNQQITQHTCSKVTKRAGGVLGGVSGVSTNDTVIQQIAAFAVTELNGLQNAQNSLVKVLSAKEQVVAGIKYILKLSLQEGGKTQICDVEIWNQPWTNHTELLSQHCVATTKRQLGGVVTGSLTEPVQKAVSFAEDALNAKSNSLFRIVTEKVDNITEQIVAGVKYTFDLHLVTSSCSNTDGSSMGKGINACPANTNSVQHQTCKVSVLEQLWAKPQYTLLSDSCSQLF